MANSDQGRVTRRDIIRSAVPAAVGALGFASLAQAQAGFEKLDPESPQAKALGYVHDTTKVDPKKNPTHKPDQWCHNCLQITGKPGDEWRGCNIFPKKLVHKDGWCRVWVKKPGAA